MVEKPDNEKKEVKNTKKNNDGDSKILAAISYLIGVLAIIIYFIKKDDKYVKFHALQATALSVTVFILIFVIGIINVILGIISGGFLAICGTLLIFGLVFVAIIYFLYLAYKAYQGEMVEVPMISSFIKKQL